MGNTLTGQIVAETYEALLKVTDNGIITGTKKRITDGFGNDTPLLLSSTDVQIDGNFLLPGTTLQYVRGDGSLATFPTIISTLTTTGSSGASTLIGSTLNIPNYTLTGLGGVPTSRTLTINGTTFDLSANRSWTITDTGLTSVGISMPSAFTVSNSPLTVNGTIAITGAGLASQYIRGDGTLANFPTTGGGGSSVSYYMNGSVNQGTILGNTYYEFNKTPIIGAGTDFTINANGYISQFITDANDPALLEIPGGNWNFEMYFSASSGGGSPSFYVELYKYNGTSFTLIASNSTTPEGITGGTAIDLYTTALAVPQTVLTLTDRLAIRVYVTHSGRTITLHTENSHLCQVITTFSTGITALNSLTKQVQYFAVGTSGTDFAISSATDTHTFNLPTASGTNRGALSSADWTTFNGKESVLTFSSPLSRSVNTISIPAATTSVNGYLTSTDWTTFNSKVPSTRTLTINGTAYDLSADRSWTISTGVSGSGTTNYVPKFTGSSAIGNSIIFDNGTQVGIGTTSPGARLDVSQGNINLSNSFYLTGRNNANTLNIGLIGRNSADRVIIDADGYGTTIGGGGSILLNPIGGNVGIGTTSPTEKLTVNGAIQIFADSAGNGYGSKLDVPFNGVNAYDFTISTRNNSTSWSERMRITSAGNVGIGTSSPNAKLTVASTDVPAASFYRDLDVLSVGPAGQYFDIGARKGATFTPAIRIAGVLQSNGDDGFLQVSTLSGGLVFERMRITSGGNVGIGTSSPSYTLDVNGTGRFNSSVTAANALLQSANTNAVVDIFTLYNPSQTSSGVRQKFSNGYGDLAAIKVSQRDNGPLADDGQIEFQVASNASLDTKLTILNTGNVVIGTTSPSDKLTVSGGSIKNIISTTSSSHLQTTNSNGSTYFGNDATGGYVYTDWNSPFLFYTNSAERMRITSSGNVGIGTTDASAQISGTERVLKISSSGVASLYLESTSAARTWSNYINSVGTLTWYDITAGATRMSITSDGAIQMRNVFNRTTTSYTLVLGDAGKIVETNVGSANNLTVPLNSSVTFPIGTEIAVLQYGAGQTTIVATSGVTLRSKSNALKISGQFAGCTLVKVGTDEWYVVGDLTL